MHATEPRPLRSAVPPIPPPQSPGEGERLLQELIEEATKGAQQSVLVETDCYTLAAVAGYAITAAPQDADHPAARFSRSMVRQFRAAGYPHLALLAAGQEGLRQAPQALRDVLVARVQHGGAAPDAPLPEC